MPKYQQATAVDIEASYKSMPVTSYDKYDQTEVCKPTTEGCEQVEEGTTASGKDVRTIGNLLGKHQTCRMSGTLQKL